VEAHLAQEGAEKPYKKHNGAQNLNDNNLGIAQKT
jgi:hypothetical protein